MDDLVKTARRAKGSDLLPKVSFGTMNAETLILRMADRIEELEDKLAKAVDALNRIQDGSYGKNAAIARTALAEQEKDDE